ncbi:MAG: membrane dipeptidase [bacterium]
MLDMHFDLLTLLYYANNAAIDKKDEIYSKLKEVYKTIDGGIINLYFMSKSEMFEELDISIDSSFSVLEMLKQSIVYLDEFVSTLDREPTFYYSIEGLDYVNEIDEINKLYELGVRSILPVWNNDNHFGGGSKGVSGLTNLGKDLLRRCIELGIIIDMSHMNEITFDDTIKFLENEKNNNVDFKAMVSHSNIYELCNHKRNLKDYQILKLNNVGGYFGLVMYNLFIYEEYENKDSVFLEDYFVLHIQHLIDLGINLDKIFISTDNMILLGDKYTSNKFLFDLSTTKKNTIDLLSKSYDESFIENILYNNANNFLNN